MHRTNSARDAASSGLVEVDAGEGVTLTIPVTPPEGGGGVSPDHPLLYDSGWRDVTSSLGTAVASDSTGKYYLRRRAGMVLVRLENITLAGGGTTNIAWSSLPVGFQPVGAGGGGELFQVGTATRTGGTAYIMPDGPHLRLQGVRAPAWDSPLTEVPPGHVVNGAFAFATTDPIPTTLPGDPV